MAQRHIGARTVQQVLDQAPTLAQLQQQLQHSKKCLEIVLPLLPVPLRKAVHAGPFEHGTAPDGSHHHAWILLAEHTAAASKLRQLQPLFLQYLDKAGLDIHEVKIQVLPHSSFL